jgi:hypothetical protein
VTGEEGGGGGGAKSYYKEKAWSSINLSKLSGVYNPVWYGKISRPAEFSHKEGYILSQD